MPCLEYELKERGLSYVAQAPIALTINFNVPKLMDGVKHVLNLY